MIGYENRIEGCYGNGVIGQKNILIDSYDMYILGQNNKAQNRTVYSIIVGQENETSGTDGRGQYIFGCRNKVSGGYVIGMSNSADHGGMAFGVSNKVHNGAYAIGDYNDSDLGSLALAPACGENSANRGSIAIGWGFNNHSNSADTGSIAIGKNTYANDGAFTFGTEVSANQGSISIGRTVSAGMGSITIGFDGASAENGSFTIGKYGASAYNGSYIIGESSSASNGSMVFGKSNACADGTSISMGWNGIGASGNSITIGHDGVYSYGLNSMAIGLSGVSADHSSIAFGMNSVSAASAGMAIGAQGVTANDNTFAIGYRWVRASGAPSFAIGSQGVYAFDNGFTIGVNSISAANYSFAIGRESVSARNTSISIGMNSNFAENYGVAIGVANSAFNHSIMLGTNMTTPSFATYGSIGIHAGDGNRPFSTNNQSISIRSTYENGNVVTNYGSISIGRSEGYTYVNNDSIAIGKVDARINNTGINPPPENILSADNYSIAIGKAGFHPMMVNNQSTFIGNSTNASAYATNMSYVIGIAGGHYYPGSSQYGTGILSADNRSLIFGGSMNRSSIVEHDSVSIGFDNIGYYGAMMFGDCNSAYNHYSGNSPTNTWTNAYILGDFNEVENYRGVLSTDSPKNKLTHDGVARTMSLVIGNDNRVTGYNAFTFGSQNRNGMSSYSWNGSSYSWNSHDDGFTYTFGLQNYAARNYDMAIGYSAMASGGENIAIGCPINDYQTRLGNLQTKAIGYKNIAIRSEISGIGNIGIDSYNLNFTKYSPDSDYLFTRNRFDRVFNLTADMATGQGFWSNTLKDVSWLTLKLSNNASNISKNDFEWITSGYDSRYNYVRPSITVTGSSECINYNKIIYYDGAHMKADSLYANMMLYMRGFSADNFGEVTNNILYNSIFVDTSGSPVSIYNSMLYRTSAYLGHPASGTPFIGDSRITQSWLIGTETSGSVFDSFSFGAIGTIYRDSRDYTFPSLSEVSRIVQFGDSSAFNSCMSFIEGDQNAVNGGLGLFVAGQQNYVHSCIASGHYAMQDSGKFVKFSNIIGTTNTIFNMYSNSTLNFNNIFGAHNTIASKNEVLENNLIGTHNRILSLNNFGGYAAALSAYSVKYMTEANSYSIIAPISNYRLSYEYGEQEASAQSAFGATDVVRNTIIGDKNLVSDYVNNSYVLGNTNTIYNDGIEIAGNTVSTGYNAELSNNIVLGAYNMSFNGSNQFVVGFNNVASGHHSIAIGEELRSNKFQTIIGKYNEPVEGTVRTTSAYNPTTSAVYALENTGVLFAIGNGRLRAYEKPDGWYNSNGTKMQDYAIYAPGNIEQSNAMIVSANGLVSAANLATSGYGDIESTLDALNTITYNNAQNINDLSAAIGDIETLLAAL